MMFFDYYGGLDCTVLGIGNNAHILFNEPGSSFDSKTRKVKLDKRTISDNSRFLIQEDEVPKADNGIKNYYGLERNLFDSQVNQSGKSFESLRKITESVPIDSET